MASGIADSSGGLQIELLGPVAARVDGRPVVGGSAAAGAVRRAGPDTRLDTEFVEPARTRHGTHAWDAAARDGGTLSFEDAIAYALHEPRA